MSGGLVRYTVASWRNKHSWTGGSVAAAATAATFLLLSRDERSHAAEHKVAQAEPLLFYGQHHADSVLADRPRFVGQFSPPPGAAGKQQQQQTKEQVAASATATTGMKPQHTVR
jgi:hypothetical protein